MQTPIKIWLRAEIKPGEARRPLTPQEAKTLVANGFDITVEESATSAIPADQYTDSGCSIAAAGSWRDAPANAYILGLKELPDDETALYHRHIYFAHAYKKQTGWQRLLQRFGDAGGSLLDLEYLLDDSSRRVAAFGYWAGFAGAALGVMAWCAQHTEGRHSMGPLRAYENREAMIAEVRSQLTRCNSSPRILIVGAHGRVGSGALALAQQLGLETISWDINETAAGGPFSEILMYDILVNCVLVQSSMPPFITDKMLDLPRKLSVITDVSCDPYGDYNPIPLYQHCSTMAEPIIHLRPPPAVMDLIAIDNLPTLLPLESSIDFSRQLLPTLLQLQQDQNNTWSRASGLFDDFYRQASECTL